MTQTLIEPWQFENPACRGKDTETYYMPDRDDPAAVPVDKKARKAAKILCGSCVHQSDCAEWGLHYERWGIWGGLDEKEHREIRKKRGILVPE